VLRQNYLRRIRANRDSKGSYIKPEIYLDESDVNKNLRPDFIWYSQEDGPFVQKPTGTGERLIILNAISLLDGLTVLCSFFKLKEKPGIIMAK